MPLLSIPFLIVALLGFAVSVAVHAVALFGVRLSFEWLTTELVAGAMLVGFSAVIAVRDRDFERKDFLKEALRGCPDWTRFLMIALWLYFLLTWILFIFVSHPPKSELVWPNNAPSTCRWITAQTMLVYAMSAGCLYSGIMTRPGTTHRCPKGHLIPASSPSCDTCARDALRIRRRRARAD